MTITIITIFTVMIITINTIIIIIKRSAAGSDDRAETLCYKARRHPGKAETQIMKRQWPNVKDGSPESATKPWFGTIVASTEAPRLWVAWWCESKAFLQHEFSLSGNQRLVKVYKSDGLIKGGRGERRGGLNGWRCFPRTATLTYHRTPPPPCRIKERVGKARVWMQDL